MSSYNAKVARTGKFFPQNPQKYVGDINNIVFRSSWELKLMKVLDTKRAVLKWGSEELSIIYFDPVSDKNRRYFPDFFAIVKKDDGTEEKILIEIKPFHETIEPTTDKTKTGQPTKKYLYESMTYQTNKAKWEAALKFCNANGVKFLIMDEYSLGIKRRP